MNKLLLSIIALTLSFDVLALDMDYYAPNGSPTVMEAFKRLALIYSDGTYKLFFGGIAILGMLIAYANGQVIKPLLQGVGKSDSINWVTPFIVGSTLYIAAFLSTGTIHVYDSVKNHTSSIAGVPNAIVAIAGLSNILERNMIEITDTASAYPYTENAGGVNLQLFLDTNYTAYQNKKLFLSKDLQSYKESCGNIAMGLSGNQNEQNLMSDTTSLYGLLPEWGNHALFVNVYNGTPGLTSMTCNQAWTNVLLPALSISKFTSMAEESCAKNGWDLTDIAQAQKCKTLIANSATIHGQSASSAENYMRDAFIANTLMKKINLEDPTKAQETLMRRQLVLQGLGAMNTVDDTMPNLKAVMTAIILGIIPFLTLFLVTPLWSKALKFITLSLLWLTTWGVMMAVSHAATMDSAIAVLSDIRSNKMGIDAFMLAQTDGVKAMMLFGKMQSNSLMMATAIAIGVYGFGSYALTGMAQSQALNMQHMGENAAHSALTPEGRSTFREGLSQGVASDTMISKVPHEGLPSGGANVFGGTGYEAQHQADAGVSAKKYGAGEQTNISSEKTAGAIGASETIGRTEGIGAVANANDITVAQQVSKTAETDALTQQTRADAQRGMYEQLGNGSLTAGAALQSSKTTADQIGAVEKVQGFANGAGLDNNNPQDIQTIASNLSRNNGQLAMNQDTYLNSSFFDATNPNQQNMAMDDSYKNSTFLVGSSFNDDGSIADVKTSIGDSSMRLDGSTNVDRSTVQNTRDKTLSGSETISGDSTVYDSTNQKRVGPNIGTIRDAILNDGNQFVGEPEKLQSWADSQAAFVDRYNQAKSGDVNAREQLVDVTSEMFKDVQGTMSTQDIVSFFTKEGVSGGLKAEIPDWIPVIGGSGVEGNVSAGSMQETKSEEGIRAELNRSYVNHILENSQSNVDFADNIRNLHEQQRNYAINQGKDSDMKDDTKKN